MCAQSPQNHSHCRRLLKSPQKIAGRKDMWKNHKYSPKKLKVTGNRKKKKVNCCRTVRNCHNKEELVTTTKERRTEGRNSACDRQTKGNFRSTWMAGINLFMLENISYFFTYYSHYLEIAL